MGLAFQGFYKRGRFHPTDAAPTRPLPLYLADLRRGLASETSCSQLLHVFPEA